MSALEIEAGNLPFFETDILSEQLDRWYENIRSLKDVNRAIDELTSTLKRYRDAASGSEWAEVVDLGRRHPLKSLIDQDPFSHWSFTQPRGYPGDAHLLDFIYHHADARSEAQSATPVGRAIYARNLMVPACRAVRHRRDLLAARIDEVCAACPNARVLSLAAGHLREAEISDAVAAGALDVLFALDQDENSLRVISQTHGTRKIRPLKMSVKNILTNRFLERDFDFIYAAGLYDYLEPRVAARLTQILYDKLRPGGRLLVANFLKSAEDAGYMDVYMNWRLLLRSEREFLAAIGDAVEHAAAVCTYNDDSDTIVYIELIRS